MKKKRNITVTVIVVCVLCLGGFIAQRYCNWSVDNDQTSGDIAKSSRFSRKTVDGGVSNMQELLANDKEYRNNLVVAHTVMQARANQFDALVDMSVEVAGDISDFDAILKDMKAVKPMVKNVCSSMASAGADLNAALGGETRHDLNQTTNNAALAYNTLQKQNELADRFIEAVDKYVKKSKADDRLKLVRDQWVDYQLMTAALNKDTKASQKLENSGYLLSSDKAVSALSSFDAAAQLKIFDVAAVERIIGFNPDGLLSSSETFGELMGEFDRQGLLAATNKDGLVAATNKDGLIAATNKDGLIAATNKDGLVAATNKDGLVAATNKDGLVAATNKDGLIAATNKDGLIAATNKDGLLAANNLDGLLSLVVLQFDGANLASAFGEATRALQNFNPEGMASHDVSGSGLLHLDPSGYLGQTVNPTIASLAAGTGQAVTNFSGAGVQSGN